MNEKEYTKPEEKSEKGGREERVEKTAPTMITDYELKFPIEYQGETIEKIHLDFTELNGYDALAIEDELEAQNSYPLAPEISKTYQAALAARAGNLPGDFMRLIKLYDFNRITNIARNFLLGQDL